MVENQLASFWRPALSQAFAGGGATTPTTATNTKRNSVPRKGTRTPRLELAAKAKALHAGDHSYGEIAKILGIPKSTVWDLVNGE